MLEQEKCQREVLNSLHGASELQCFIEYKPVHLNFKAGEIYTFLPKFIRMKGSNSP